MLDILIGLQWGDEGKGKIVDVLTENYDIIARYQGGPNAGHTLKIGDRQIILHLVPSGIMHQNTINVIGNGVVLDPVVFMGETSEISKLMGDIRDRIYISSRSHLILPTHKLLDAAYEKSKGKRKIGSTLRGIGPAYADKISRNGIRTGEINSRKFDELLSKRITEHLKLLDYLEYEDFDLTKLMDQWSLAVENLRNFKIIDTGYFLNQELNSGARILAEGAQGTLLDIDFGTYPYVTSSNTIAAGALTGLGIPANKVNKVFGVFKAYTTRVGNGPFPSELNDETGEELRRAGMEFGATTGRPRRTGWLDLIALKYSVMINGVDELIMTKADVLNGFDKIKVVTGYQVEGQETSTVPLDMSAVEKVITQSLSGWKEPLNTGGWDKLPENFKNYVEYIENFVGAKVTAISTGPRRREIIWR